MGSLATIRIYADCKGSSTARIIPALQGDAGDPYWGLHRGLHFCGKLRGALLTFKGK